MSHRKHSSQPQAFPDLGHTSQHEDWRRSFKTHKVVFIVSYLVDVGAVLAVFYGIIEIYHSCAELFDGAIDEAIKFLIKGLDAWLMGVVMALFASGLRYLLLLPESERLSLKSQYLAGRAGATDFHHLKRLLFSAIVLVIVVRYLAVVLSDPYNLKLDSLAIPAGVLMLSGSLLLLKQSHE